MQCMVRGLLARESSSVSPSTVLFQVLATQTASNCWFRALNVAVVHGLLYIVGNVCGCLVVKRHYIARGVALACFALACGHANVAKPVLQGIQACTV